MKRLFALLVAIMILVAGVAAYAEENEDATPVAGDVSITIRDNESAGGTVSTEYNYYELLHASINGTAVSYYLLNGTDDALRTLLDAVTVNGADLFTFTQSTDGTRWNLSINKKADGTEYTDSDGPAIAAALNTTAIKEAALRTGTFSQDNSGSVFANVEEKGYYLITSTLGTNLVLQTLGKVDIDTKNEYHTDEKTANKTNMEVGDIVTYTITVNIPTTYEVGEEVTVHDTLDEHLKADLTTLVAKLGENEVTLTDGTKKVATETFAKKFTITEAMLGHAVVLTYDAELLSTAADDTGYVNTEFTNTSDYETPEKKVRVWTFDFDLDKEFVGATAAQNDEFTATFKLVGPDNEQISFVKSGNNYVKADTDDTNTVNILTVNGTNVINVNGLEAGVYTLTELTTADGYNLLTESITVTITDTTPEAAKTDESINPTHTVSYKIGSADAIESTTVTIQNNSGTRLPSTGGVGTTIFYVGGSILVIAAVILLVTKRRMSTHD